MKEETAGQWKSTGFACRMFQVETLKSTKEGCETNVGKEIFFFDAVET